MPASSSYPVIHPAKESTKNFTKYTKANIPVLLIKKSIVARYLPSQYIQTTMQNKSR